MKVAILGAGYTGLACAWHLLHSPLRPRGLQVTLFDRKGVGGGASGIAAGLLHPFVGLHARLNWRGTEGMEATKKLLDESSTALGRKVYAASGILRVAMSEEQEKNFRHCAKENEGVVWWEASECSKNVPSVANHRGGIFIKAGKTVFSSDYLQGLWRSCQLQNAEFSRLPIDKLAQCRHFDRIVVAAGAGIPEIEELAELPITLVKGQLLQIEWPAEVDPLPFSVNSQAYVVMSPDNKSCMAGATYEREFDSLKPDAEVARAEILPKLSFLPHLQQGHIIGCAADVRVSTRDHLPLVAQVTPRIWVITGMGSKGLLYHALMARELSEKVLLSAGAAGR